MPSKRDKLSLSPAPSSSLVSDIAACCAPLLTPGRTPGRTPSKRRKKSRSSSRSGSKLKSRSRSRSKTPTPSKRNSSSPTPAPTPAPTPTTPTNSNYILTPSQCTRLKNWKYKSGSSTPLDAIMNHFWEATVHLLPPSMAPNLVTLTGFVVVAFTSLLLLSHTNYDFTSPAPSSIYALALFGHFFYQTMDSIDGKQARRTNSSSPLGQLFDHGCDAFVTILIGILNASIMCYGSSPWTVLNTTLNFNVFFLAQWEEYHSGVINTNNGWIGLTEGQFMQMGTMLSVVIWGPEVWTIEISPGWEARYAVLVPMAAVTLMLSFQAFFRVMFGGDKLLASKEERGRKELGAVAAILQMLPQYAIYYLNYRWTVGVNEELFKECTFLVYFAGGLAAAFYTTIVIVSQMSKSPIPWGEATVKIVLPMLLCVEVVGPQYSEGDKQLALMIYVVWLVATYLYYVVGVCWDLSNALGVKIFSVEKAAGGRGGKMTKS